MPVRELWHLTLATFGHIGRHRNRQAAMIGA
jgi:hypothetical protein